MAGLPRELIKWLQSLDLTWQVKTPKWDLTNGFLIAEIFSWYYPQEIQMHSYNNGASLDSKLRNWYLLRNFIKRHKMEIPEDYVEETIHCKEGAAQLLIERIYEILTNRPVRKFDSSDEIDFSDRVYQNKLPPHARSTASQALKNNIKSTEIKADPNIVLNQQKSQYILNGHLVHRVQERTDDPARFDIKPSLGERCPRRAPAPPHSYTPDSTMLLSPEKSPTKSFVKTKTESPDYASPSPVHYREISVHQSEPPEPLPQPITANC